MADTQTNEIKVSNRKQEKVGEVVSTKMTKTIVVEVVRRSAHPLYHRIVTRGKRFYAHDETETAKLGDVVRIVESRPLSKLKRWTLAEVVRRSRISGAPVVKTEGEELLAGVPKAKPAAPATLASSESSTEVTS
jgi:small subunit ribosomal protein S17